MRLSVLVLPGDGIGPEVTREAVRVLRTVCERFGHDLELLTDGLIGGAAIERAGVPLPDETRTAAQRAGAVLLGAVGRSDMDALPPDRRPERGLLDLRQTLNLFANIRPVRARAATLHASPVKDEIVRDVDLVVVRELTGGLYYGTPRGQSGSGGDERAVNTMTYTRAEIERIARVAFELAGRRRKKVTSVDKANVLETSQLWRRTVTAVAAEYPDVALEHLYVDNCAMQLVLAPRQFDVLLTENLFGDILSDEAAVLAGSIGVLPSASIGRSEGGSRRGLYEPVHGSAPSLAGLNRANPLGAIASVSALLEHSFGLQEEAEAVTRAIDAVVASGIVTADLAGSGRAYGTDAVGHEAASAVARWTSDAA